MSSGGHATAKEVTMVMRFWQSATLCLVTVAFTSWTAPTPIVVVPNENGGQSGNGAFVGPMAGTPRTYQMLIHADELVQLLDHELTGLSWRLPVSTVDAWPPISITYGTYEIYLSQSVAPANRSFNFAQNVVGPQVRVRKGSLHVPDGTFDSQSDSSLYSTAIIMPFCPNIKFDLPYLYEGGHLLLEIRHLGNDAGISRTLDARTTTSPGYETRYSALWASGNQAVNGQPGNFTITRFTTDSDAQQQLGTKKNLH